MEFILTDTTGFARKCYARTTYEQIQLPFMTLRHIFDFGKCSFFDSKNDNNGILAGEDPLRHFMFDQEYDLYYELPATYFYELLIFRTRIGEYGLLGEEIERILTAGRKTIRKDPNGLSERHIKTIHVKYVVGGTFELNVYLNHCPYPFVSLQIDSIELLRKRVIRSRNSSKKAAEWLNTVEGKIYIAQVIKESYGWASILDQ